VIGRSVIKDIADCPISWIVDCAHDEVVVSENWHFLRVSVSSVVGISTGSHVHRQSRCGHVTGRIFKPVALCVLDDGGWVIEAHRLVLSSAAVNAAR